MANTVLEKAIRRQQILDSAIRAIARKGYRCASVTDIVFEAGVARGTFYIYFQSKEEVFRAILDYYLQGIKNLVMSGESYSHSGGDISSRLKYIIGGWLRFLDDNKDMAKIIIREAPAIDPDYDNKYSEVASAVKQYWENLLVKLQKEGLVRKECKVEIVAPAIPLVINQIFADKMLREGRTDLDMMTTELADFVVKGLRQDEWMRWG